MGGLSRSWPGSAPVMMSGRFITTPSISELGLPRAMRTSLAAITCSTAVTKPSTLSRPSYWGRKASARLSRSFSLRPQMTVSEASVCSISTWV